MSTGEKRPRRVKREKPVGRSSPWVPLQSRLAEALGALEDAQYIVLTAKRGSAYVQFAVQGDFGLRAESVGNRYLPVGKKLERKQIAALQKLGWLSPTGMPRKGAPKRRTDGSPNFFHDFKSPVPFDEVALLAVRTLTEVHGIKHPRSLEYQAFDREQGLILLPTLGLKRRQPSPPSEDAPGDTAEEIRTKLLETMRDVSDIRDLEFDEDGDLALRCGSAVVFVRVLEEPPCVRIFSPVLAKIEKRGDVLALLNRLNVEGEYVRFFVEEESIFAAIDLPGSPFVAEHVAEAFSRLGSLADEVDGKLQKLFGGRTAFQKSRRRKQVQ